MTGTPTNKLNEQRKSSNLKFIHKTPISEGYKPIINDPKELRFEYLLKDRNSDKHFRFNDIETIKYKKNKMIDILLNLKD